MSPSAYPDTLFLFLLTCIYLMYFFFNDTATTEIYTLSLHDALPISSSKSPTNGFTVRSSAQYRRERAPEDVRSEEHTSELQHHDLVCRLLLEKKKDDARLDLHPRPLLHLQVLELTYPVTWSTRGGAR